MADNHSRLLKKARHAFKTGERGRAAYLIDRILKRTSTTAARGSCSIANTAAANPSRSSSASSPSSTTRKSWNCYKVKPVLLYDDHCGAGSSARTSKRWTMLLPISPYRQPKYQRKHRRNPHPPVIPPRSLPAESRRCQQRQLPGLPASLHPPQNRQNHQPKSAGSSPKSPRKA